MFKHKLRRVLRLVPVALLCGALAMPVSAAPLGPSPALLVQAWDAVQDLVPGALLFQTVSPTLRVEVGADDGGGQQDPVGQSEELKVSFRDPAVKGEKAIKVELRKTNRLGE